VGPVHSAAMRENYRSIVLSSLATNGRRSFLHEPLYRNQTPKGKQKMQFFSKNITAARLGISTRTLDRMTENGTGPHVTRVGRRVLFRADLLTAWIESRG
jgi:excisionase family DNA binding protein